MSLQGARSCHRQLELLRFVGQSAAKGAGAGARPRWRRNRQRTRAVADHRSGVLEIADFGDSDNFAIGNGDPFHQFQLSRVAEKNWRLLGLNDLVGDSVAAVEPLDNLSGPLVVDCSVAQAECICFFAKPIEPDVLEREKILANEFA